MSAHERERLAGYLDGELPPAERAEVEAHLATCEECASLLAEMGAVDDVARGLPLEVPSGYLEALPGRVRARIERESPPRARTVVARPRWRLPVWTWAAAAALLLAVVTPLTLPRLYRARVATTEMPATATPMEEAMAPAPQSAPERRVSAPADDEQLARLAPKREAGRGQRAEDRADEPAPAFAPPPAAAAPSDPAAPAPRPRARPGKLDVAAEAVPPTAENRPQELEKDAPALAGVAPSVVAEGEALGEAPPPEPDVDRRQAVMTDTMASRPVPATLGAAKAGASAPQATETREGFASVEKKSVLDEDSVAFGRLTRDVPADAAAWRERREAWRAFVATHPRSRHVDEARVRVIEAGLEAWREGGEPEDLARAREDAEAYLARDDARLKQRVRQALEAAEGP